MDAYIYENILCKPIIFDKIIHFINNDSKINFITSQKFLFEHYLTTIKEYTIKFNENSDRDFSYILEKINLIYPNLQILTLDLKNTNEIKYDKDTKKIIPNNI